MSISGAERGIAFLSAGVPWVSFSHIGSHISLNGNFNCAKGSYAGRSELSLLLRERPLRSVQAARLLFVAQQAIRSHKQQYLHAERRLEPLPICVPQ